MSDTRQRIAELRVAAARVGPRFGYNAAALDIIDALPALLDAVEAADEYMREADNPAPDYVMRHRRREALRAALARLGAR